MFEVDPNSILHKEEFGKRFTEFCKKFDLSIVDISTICDNARNLSKSSVQRLKKGEVLDQNYLPAITALEKYLTVWLESQNIPFFETEEILNNLFPHRSTINMIIHRCELTATAVKFFGLKADPFDIDRVPGEDEMFASKELDEIAMRVKDAVLYQKFTSVVGTIGSGKTTLKIRVARELDKSSQQVHLLYPEFFDMNSVNVGAIANSILEEFEIKPPRDKTAKMRKIREVLTSFHKDDIRVALIFDECHRLNPNVLTSLKNFWEMTNGGYSRLVSIILFGQPKFIDTVLRDPKFREITERVSVLEMPSLAKSAREYLTHKVSLVGGDINELFEKKAVDALCRVAKTPLALGNLANNALMKAFENEEKQVAASMLNLPDASQVKAIRRAA